MVNETREEQTSRIVTWTVSRSQTIYTRLGCLLPQVICPTELNGTGGEEGEGY